MEKTLMVRNMTLTVVLFAGCACCIALVSRADSAQASGKKPFQPAISVHHLMEGQELVFDQLNDAIKKTELPRRTHTIEALASILAELANVNTQNSDQDDYQGWAAELRGHAMTMAEEADKKKDADNQKMLKIYKNMRQICIACHNVYQ